MKTKNFLIPDGIEYYMPPEAEKFEQLKYKILGIYKKYKYKYVYIIKLINKLLINRYINRYKIY